MRALFSGVTGIRSHQLRMDVIGNNIANVNTTGFKASRVTFQDVFSQTLSAGSTRTTPQQVGLGVGIGSTDLDMGAGSFELTGRDLDLAIEGNGMFVEKGTDGVPKYSRAGNFGWDSQGYLVNPATGDRVQGWMSDADGQFTNATQATMSDIQVVKGSISLAVATTKAGLAGNLDAGAAPQSTTTASITAYDSLGRPQPILVTFTNNAGSTWSWTATGPLSSNVTGTGTLMFDNNGALISGAGGQGSTGTITLSPPDANPGQQITVDFSHLSQAFSSTKSSEVQSQDVNGYPMGTLESVAIDASGVAYGMFSNGYRRPLAQVGLANFSNPGGLAKAGNSSFAETSASGAAMIGQPNSSGRGRLIAGNLEMSNVDISQEFTDMIMTQRGFQANTRLISTADQMLDDLVNLRR